MSHLSKQDCAAIFQSVHRGMRGKVTAEQLEQAAAFFDDVQYQIEYYRGLMESIRRGRLDVVFDRHGEMRLVAPSFEKVSV